MTSAGKQPRNRMQNRTRLHRRAGVQAYRRTGVQAYRRTGVQARGGSRLTNQVSNEEILRGSTPLCLAERLAENCSSLAIFGYVFDIVVPPHGKLNFDKVFIVRCLK